MYFAAGGNCMLIINIVRCFIAYFVFVFIIYIEWNGMISGSRVFIKQTDVFINIYLSSELCFLNPQYNCILYWINCFKSI